MTRRKLVVLALILLASSVVLAKALDSLIERFTEAPEASVHGRVLFEASAHAMLGDHPLGIGLNQFSWVQAHDGYADALAIPEIDRDGIVHNIYRLTQAELGWPGIVVFMGLLASPMLRAILALTHAACCTCPPQVRCRRLGWYRDPRRRGDASPRRSRLALRAARAGRSSE
ncbi:MAG: hypothetical protein NT062_17190 [Proteobacteria bacterium]|nr:hypothetical protein [Pseudomonadota bacterium]